MTGVTGPRNNRIVTACFLLITAGMLIGAVGSVLVFRVLGTVGPQNP